MIVELGSWELDGSVYFSGRDMVDGLARLTQYNTTRRRLNCSAMVHPKLHGSDLNFAFSFSNVDTGRQALQGASMAERQALMMLLGAKELTTQ